MYKGDNMENNRRESLQKEILDLRLELLELNEEINENMNFLIIFIKTLVISFFLYFMLRFFSFEDRKSVPIFIVFFFMVFFVLAIKMRKDLQKHEKEIEIKKVKLQGQIFAKYQEIRKIDDKNKLN